MCILTLLTGIYALPGGAVSRALSVVHAAPRRNVAAQKDLAEVVVILEDVIARSRRVFGDHPDWNYLPNTLRMARSTLSKLDAYLAERGHCERTFAKGWLDGPS